MSRSWSSDLNAPLERAGDEPDAGISVTFVTGGELPAAAEPGALSTHSAPWP
jgi:hypothetical protein